MKTIERRMSATTKTARICRRRRRRRVERVQLEIKKS
jgi:hypothetical protein